jgi:hypothetical protein
MDGGARPSIEQPGLMEGPSMRGLGRLFALPFLLIALAVQSLAPAEAAAMQPDASPFGICSAHELSGDAHRPDPAKNHDHDCCAFACALVGLGAAPPVQAFPAVARAETPAAAPARRFDLAPGRGLAAPPPPSQGPPTLPT